MITIRSVLLVVMVVLAGACAQLLMKFGINSVSSESNSASDPLFLFRQLLRNPAVWAALMLYAGGLAAWMVALSRLSLSFAYSFQALTYFLVPLGSIWLLGEFISLLRWVGIGVICLGILIVAISPWVVERSRCAWTGPNGSMCG